MEPTHNQDAVRRLDEDDAFFSAIGRFAFEFSQLEYEVRMSVAQSARVPDEYFDSIMTHDVALLCNAARRVFAQQLNAIRLAKIEELIKEFRGLNDERVKIFHDLWVVNIGGGRLFHVSRQKLQSTVHFDGPGGLAIARLADRANKLRSDWGEALWSMES